MEQDWGTLKTAIADYWMNHSWLEDQKFRANNVQYRDAGHSHKTQGEYVIRKMGLIRLVYDYMDSEIIRLIVKFRLYSPVQISSFDIKLDVHPILIMLVNLDTYLNYSAHVSISTLPQP